LAGREEEERMVGSAVTEGDDDLAVICYLIT
jgi:hypothetical protein